MKVLTLHQPWAHWVAMGHKTIENRNRPTPYRGPLAIHAAKIRVAECRNLIRFALRLGWITEDQAPTIDELRAHAGRIVAVVSLTNVVPASSIPPGTPWVMGRDNPDAYCWTLEGVRRLETPLLFKGRQGGPSRLSDAEAAAVELACK